MSAPVVFFYVFAVLAIVSALGMVLNVRNTVASALSLVVTMVSLAGIYVLMEAYIIAVFQIMVYGGAIVVLFLFVVMLLNLRTDSFGQPRLRSVKAVGAVLAGILLAQLLGVTSGVLTAPPTVPEGYGGYRALGLALYTDYVLLVELTGLVLLAAIVGALILAKRDID